MNMKNAIKHRGSSLNIGDLLTHAWSDYRKHPGFFLAIAVIVLSSFVFSFSLDSTAGEMGGGESFASTIITNLVLAIATTYVIRATLRFVDKGDTHLGSAVPPVQNVIWYIVFQIFMTLLFTAIIFVPVTLIAIGTVFLTVGSIDFYNIMPEIIRTLVFKDLLILSVVTFLCVIVQVFLIIYFSIRFMFTTYAIVDRNFDVVRAMRASGLLTKGVKLKLLWLSFVLLCVNIIGAIVFFVGLFVTVPLTFLVMARTYRLLYNALREDAVLREQKNTESTKKHDKRHVQEIVANAPAKNQSEEAKDAKRDSEKNNQDTGIE